MTTPRRPDDYTPVLVPGELLTVRTAGRITAGDPLEVAGPGPAVQRAGAGSLAYLGIAAESCATDAETTVMIGGTIQEAIADGDITAGDLVAASAEPGRVVVAVPGGGPVPPSAPTVTGVNPATGPAAGGTAVTITGTDLTGATGVTFAGAAATVVVVVDDTTVTCVSPAGTAGPARSVAVTTPAGTGTLPGAFTYIAPPSPTVTGINPNTGLTTGGEPVTITGTNLAAATAVTIGGANATAVVPVNATTVTCDTPPGATGPARTVAVTTPAGTGSLPLAFTYANPPPLAPTVTGVAPATGPEAGGTPVTITGTNFTGATQATFGGTPATAFTVASDTSITCTTPAGTGVVPVAVTGPGGTGPLPAAFTYTAPPPPALTITAITPNNGTWLGGSVNRTITGTGFSVSPPAVEFDGYPATAVTVTDDTSLTCVPPAGPPGQAVDVTVTTTAGTGTLPGGYTYTIGSPLLISITPDTGPEAGGTLVAVSGANFAAGYTQLTIGGNPLTGMIVNPTQIAGDTPPGTGTVDVEVTTPGGTDTLAGAFTYQPGPPPPPARQPQAPPKRGKRTGGNGTGDGPGTPRAGDTADDDYWERPPEQRGAAGNGVIGLALTSAADGEPVRWLSRLDPGVARRRVRARRGGDPCGGRDRGGGGWHGGQAGEDGQGGGGAAELDHSVSPSIRTLCLPTVHRSLLNVHPFRLPSRIRGFGSTR